MIKGNPFDELGKYGPDSASLSNLALIIVPVALVIIYGLGYNFLVKYENYFFSMPDFFNIKNK